VIQPGRMATAYHRLSQWAKAAYAFEQLRANPVECPACQVGVPPGQLDAHAARCAAKGLGGTELLGWVLWAVLRESGVNWSSLQRWLVNGQVRRRRIGAGPWRYSRADVLVALERVAERRRRQRSERARLSALARWRGPVR
jgi:hypothetical protein